MANSWHRFRVKVITTYNNNYAKELLNSLLIVALFTHFVLLILLFVEMGKDRHINRQLPYNKLDRDYLLSKSTWFYIFMWVNIYNLMWLVGYKLSINETVASGHLVNMPKVDQNLSHLVNSDISTIWYNVLQYNHYVYKNILYWICVSCFGIFLIMSYTAFNDRINNARFKDYLLIYGMSIITSIPFSFFILQMKR